MQLVAKDQIHVSGVQADTLRPGQVFEVSEERAQALLRSHPGIFAVVEEAARAAEPLHAAPATKRRAPRTPAAE